MAPKIKYVYFNVRGRGELVRLILNAAGIAFEDQRVEFADWPTMKPKTPLGTLPYIEIDGHVFGEYLPICRYLARKYSLMGKTEIEQLQVDIILNLVFELREAYIRFKMDSMLTEDQKKDLGEKYAKERLPQLSERVEKMLADSKTGFLVGSNLTLADMTVVDVFDQALVEIPDCLTDKYPKINEHRKKIQSIPKIAEYLAKRPVTKL